MFKFLRIRSYFTDCMTKVVDFPRIFVIMNLNQVSLGIIPSFYPTDPILYLFHRQRSIYAGSKQDVGC